MSGVEELAVPASSLPFAYTVPIPLAGNGLVDVHDVRMIRFAGRIWQQPAYQAEYALQNLDAYRLTGNRRYVTRAIANAQRLVDDRHESDGSWFFPYDFDFAVNGDRRMTLHAPWYSALAQGQALSIFVRLFEVTGDDKWRAAAEATFPSLLVAPSAGKPWVTWTDAGGHLWLEEYPRWPVQDSERVLNGLIYAAFGLYDYVQLTGNPKARRLFDGAVTTAEQLFSQFRRPGGAARYSLEHGVPSATYHSIVVAQFTCLQVMTGRSLDGELAALLHWDYPAILGHPLLHRCPAP